MMFLKVWNKNHLLSCRNLHPLDLKAQRTDTNQEAELTVIPWEWRRCHALMPALQMSWEPGTAGLRVKAAPSAETRSLCEPGRGLGTFDKVLETFLSPHLWRRQLQDLLAVCCVLSAARCRRVGFISRERNAANARERSRMRVLSKAFSRLKTSLPWVPADTKLSKLDTLRLASSYISHLRQILQEDRLQSCGHPVNLTWPFLIGRSDDSPDVPPSVRLCGATA
ncbi:hypothetical protein KUCAC02_036974 [Chaenocephalus aceratus]|nr:hypothetical protein KUCAC02_036974 [Chaenocephalus aceratus]